MFSLSFFPISANRLGIILPRIGLSQEIVYYLFSSLSIHLFHPYKKKTLSSENDWNNLMTCACGREESYFLHSWCFFLFLRSSSRPFVNRNCLLLESISKILALNLRYLWQSHGGTEIIPSHSAEVGIVVGTREENEQKIFACCPQCLVITDGNW